MSIDALRDSLPAYALDQQRNLDILIDETILSDQQKWGCFLACAYATGEPLLIRALQDETAQRLSQAAHVAAKSAATIMAMNTVYYAAINLLGNHDYRAMPVNLSMTALGERNIDKIDFELWALAVSAVHQCGACLNAHEQELHKRNVTIESIQAALRIAAVTNAVAATIAIERGSP